jgi:hypothetical protein
MKVAVIVGIKGLPVFENKFKITGQKYKTNTRLLNGSFRTQRPFRPFFLIIMTV